MKRVSDSRITVAQQMTHQDANIAGNVRGGTIMKLIDNTGGIVAARHTGNIPVTASAYLTCAAMDENGRSTIIPPHSLPDGE